MSSLTARRSAEPFGVQAVWLCTNLKTGLVFEVSGPIAKNYLENGRATEEAAATRTLIEKGVSNHFTKDGLYVRLE